jgi:predicted tellurium resistance membrane protein TerC
MDLLTYDIFFGLITLTLLEIILGIDNLIFITLVVRDLPKKYRHQCRIFGLSLALIIRILMLFTLSWIMGLTDPVFYFHQTSFSYRDFLLFFGGLFLIVKSGWEILNEIFFVNLKKEEKHINVGKNVIAAVLQIALIDFVFSFDSVITAVGMTNNIPVIVTAIAISMIVMIVSSEKINYFLQTYPSLKVLALSFIFMVGVILLSDGLHFHISKGYLYFSLFFTLGVESLNIIARKRNH